MPCSTVYCFVTLDKATHEGELHVTRLYYIQNSSLFKKAVEKGLPGYLMTRAFTSRRFLPPNLKPTAGKTPKDGTHIGDKTIADVVEALLGAAYETGMPKGLRTAYEMSLTASLALGMPFDGVKDWSDFAKLYGPYRTFSGARLDVSVIEQKLGHRFGHPYLVQEALVSGQGYLTCWTYC